MIIYIMGFDMNQCFARRNTNKTRPRVINNPNTKPKPTFMCTNTNVNRAPSDLNSIRFNMELLMNTNSSGNGTRRG